MRGSWLANSADRGFSLKASRELTSHGHFIHKPRACRVPALKCQLVIPQHACQLTCAGQVLDCLISGHVNRDAHISPSILNVVLSLFDR